ncbi:protein of unknown function [Segatella bryantii]|nr:protein of unknown function [Segatella bryantii]
MHKDKYVFAQLVSFLDRNHFNYLVRKYGGDKYVKFFSCWNQLLTLMFGQLSNRESLRDLIVAIVQHDMKFERSTYEVLQILSISLTDKTPLRELFDKTIFNNDRERCLCRLDVTKAGTVGEQSIAQLILWNKIHQLREDCFF